MVARNDNGSACIMDYRKQRSAEDRRARRVLSRRSAVLRAFDDAHRSGDVLEAVCALAEKYGLAPDELDALYREWLYLRKRVSSVWR